jgi:hypothetical protein
MIQMTKCFAVGLLSLTAYMLRCDGLTRPRETELFIASKYFKTVDYFQIFSHSRIFLNGPCHGSKRGWLPNPTILRGGFSELNNKSDSDSSPQQRFNLKKMILSQYEELFSENWKQDLGYVCVGFGAFFLGSALNPIPLFGLWMSRKAIILANIMLISGSVLLVGAAEMKRFFLAGSRLVGTFLILIGFIVLWRDRAERWIMLAFFMQLLGVLSLFGPYAQSFFRFGTQFVFPTLIALPTKLFRFH